MHQEMKAESIRVSLTGGSGAYSLLKETCIQMGTGFLFDK